MSKNIRSAKITIETKDNFSLVGIFNQVENSEKAIILAHGMTVDKDDEGIFVRAEPKLNKLGFTTLRFDFRAHGESQGNSIEDFTISGELNDLEAVVAFLEDKGIRLLGLAGASFGGSISALYAGDNPDKIKALFLANPDLDYQKAFLNPTTSWAKQHFKNVFARIDKKGFIEVGSRKFKIGRKIFKEVKNYHPCKKLNNYNGPLLIVHGDQDSKVAYQDVINCYESLNNPNKRIALNIMPFNFHIGTSNFFEVYGKIEIDIKF